MTYSPTTRVFNRRTGLMATRPEPTAPVLIADSTRENQAAYEEDDLAWHREQLFIALDPADQNLALELIEQRRKAVAGLCPLDGSGGVGNDGAPCQRVALALGRDDKQQAHRLQLSLKLVDARREARGLVRGHGLLLGLLGLALIAARVGRRDEAEVQP